MAVFAFLPDLLPLEIETESLPDLNIPPFSRPFSF